MDSGSFLHSWVEPQRGSAGLKEQKAPVSPRLRFVLFAHSHDNPDRLLYWLYSYRFWDNLSQTYVKRLVSLRKQPIFGDATTGFPAKWRMRNDRRNSIPRTRHYPDLGSASDWLNHISHAQRPIRSTAQILVVTRHQYGISGLVSQTSFGGETSGSVAKRRPFSQAKNFFTGK